MGTQRYPDWHEQISETLPIAFPAETLPPALLWGKLPADTPLIPYSLPRFIPDISDCSSQTSQTTGDYSCGALGRSVSTGRSYSTRSSLCGSILSDRDGYSSRNGVDAVETIDQVPANEVDPIEMDIFSVPRVRM